MAAGVWGAEAATSDPHQEPSCRSSLPGPPGPPRAPLLRASAQARAPPSTAPARGKGSSTRQEHRCSGCTGPRPAPRREGRGPSARLPLLGAPGQPGQVLRHRRLSISEVLKRGRAEIPTHLSSPLTATLTVPDTPLETPRITTASLEALARTVPGHGQPCPWQGRRGSPGGGCSKGPQDRAQSAPAQPPCSHPSWVRVFSEHLEGGTASVDSGDKAAFYLSPAQCQSPSTRGAHSPRALSHPHP